jgi:hypothetical protein
MKMTYITFCIKTETIFISPAKQAVIERSSSITSLQSADRSGRQHVAEPLIEWALLLSKNVSLTALCTVNLLTANQLACVFYTSFKQ